MAIIIIITVLVFLLLRLIITNIDLNKQIICKDKKYNSLVKIFNQFDKVKLYKEDSEYLSWIYAELKNKFEAQPEKPSPKSLL